jgi:hypothetical protein
MIPQSLSLLRHKPGSPATGGWKTEIIKGTGRFEGIKGTASSKTKFLPPEKGNLDQRLLGMEPTTTLSLPSDF